MIKQETLPTQQSSVIYPDNNIEYDAPREFPQAGLIAEKKIENSSITNKSEKQNKSSQSSIANSSIEQLQRKPLDNSRIQEENYDEKSKQQYIQALKIKVPQAYRQISLKNISYWKQKYNISLNKDNHQLNLRFKQIKLPFFRYKYHQLAILSLISCSIDNHGWNEFIKCYSNFGNLTVLWLSKNRISEVKEGQLQLFEHLTCVLFGNQQCRPSYTDKTIKCFDKYIKINQGKKTLEYTP